MQRWHQIEGQQETEVLTGRFTSLIPSLSPEGSQLLVPSATNMQTQGVPRFHDFMSWMGSKHIKTACFQPLRVEDPWVVLYQFRWSKFFWSPGEDTDRCFHESWWHVFPSETTNLPSQRKCCEVFYYGIRTACRALTFVPVVGQGLQFLALGESTWGESSVEMLLNCHVPSINLT